MEELKGFIEVQERWLEHSSDRWYRNEGKKSININHIIDFGDKQITTTYQIQDRNVAIQVEESYEEIKQLIKNAQ